MSSNVAFGASNLSLTSVDALICSSNQIRLDDKAIERINKCRAYLDNKLRSSNKAIYGVNTGFGSLCNVKVSENELTELQHNLVMSHACGMGDEIDTSIVEIMLLLKIQSLSYGHSGIREKVVQALVQLFNQRIHPQVFSMGSLGASGDLAPLAHLSLPLIGLGKVYKQGKLVDVSKLKIEGFEPLQLASKEGLALLNGTQFMAAHGVKLLIDGFKLLFLLNKIATISLEAYDCHASPFFPSLHKIRKQAGQSIIAQQIRQWRLNSLIQDSEKSHVQDPYSFRCIPQVHGASFDVLKHVATVFTNEINSVTDNPNIFPEEDMVLSGGNFHGQPLAMALDYLGLAFAELGSISERRSYALLSGERDLPVYLVKNGGINSGFMIPQYTAASLVSQNKQLATPASIDSIDSSNRQEDHVSMGANAATKCVKILDNLKRIMAIELMMASQAISFRKERTSDSLQAFIEKYRFDVPILEQDRLLHDDLMRTEVFIEREIQALKLSDVPN